LHHGGETTAMLSSQQSFDPSFLECADLIKTDAC
jgi:hypothetical protein